MKRINRQSVAPLGRSSLTASAPLAGLRSAAGPSQARPLTTAASAHFRPRLPRHATDDKFRHAVAGVSLSRPLATITNELDALELDEAEANEDPTRADAIDFDELEAEADEQAGITHLDGKFRLRPYQLDCIEAVLRSLREGHTRIGVSAPTGSGKTAIFTSLIHRLPEILHEDADYAAHRVLILVGSIELAFQARDAVQRRWPDLTVEIEQGSKRVASGAADVTIATYQTLIRGRLDKYDTRGYKAVIVDEAHHAAAKSYLEVLAHFNSDIKGSVDYSTVTDDAVQASPIAAFPSASKSVSVPSTSAHTLDSDYLPEPPNDAVLDAEGRPKVPIFGFTATFGRADGLALGKVFETICWHGEWLDMIRGSWLSQLQFTTVKLGDALDLSAVDVSAKTGEFVQTSLAAQVDRPHVTDLAVQAWLNKASDRRSTIVFAINIAHIGSIVGHFIEQGIDARYVHEGVKPRDRADTLEAFRRGDFPVLVNCGILTEGADFPAIDCVLLARPTKSANLFIQMLGRGLRLSPETGKENCLVLDLVGSSVKGLACTPTLFGIDPDLAIEAQSTDQLQQLAVKSPAPTPPPLEVVEHSASDYSVRYEEYESIFELIHHEKSAAKPRSIRSLSSNAWVGCGEGTFILEVAHSGHARIEPVGAESEAITGYEAKWYQRTNAFGGRYRTHKIGHHDDVGILIRTADGYIANKSFANPDQRDLRRSARWRQLPLTDSQRLTITKKLRSHLEVLPPTGEPGEVEKVGLEGVWLGRSWTELVELDSLSRGDAADVITRAMHGGIAALKKGKRKVAKEIKQRAKERDVAEKEQRKRERLLKREAKHTPTWANEAGTLFR